MKAIRNLIVSRVFSKGFDITGGIHRLLHGVLESSHVHVRHAEVFRCIGHSIEEIIILHRHVVHIHGVDSHVHLVHVLLALEHLLLLLDVLTGDNFVLEVIPLAVSEEEALLSGDGFNDEAGVVGENGGNSLGSDAAAAELIVVGDFGGLNEAVLVNAVSQVQVLVEVLQAEVGFQKVGDVLVGGIEDVREREELLGRRVVALVDSGHQVGHVLRRHHAAVQSVRVVKRLHHGHHLRQMHVALIELVVARLEVLLVVERLLHISSLVVELLALGVVSLTAELVELLGLDVGTFRLDVGRLDGHRSTRTSRHEFLLLPQETLILVLKVQLDAVLVGVVDEVFALLLLGLLGALGLVLVVLRFGLLAPEDTVVDVHVLHCRLQFQIYVLLFNFFDLLLVVL